MAKKISCSWEQRKRLLVNPDGQAFPCCYLANIYYQSKVFMEAGDGDKLFDGHKAQMEHPLMKSYREAEKQFNIWHSDMEDILKSEWYTKTLPESWGSDKTVHIQCKRMCEVEE